MIQLPEGSWWDWDVQDPTFRTPTPDEVGLVSRQIGAKPAVLVAFEADAGGPGPGSGLIAAGQLDIVQGTVFRYWRENLAAGERLAPWVRPPAQTGDHLPRIH